MRPFLRCSTAVMACLSLVLGQLPVMAIAQATAAPQCRDGEAAQACLDRLTEDSLAAALAARLAADEAARLAAEAAAAQDASRLAAEAGAGDEATRLSAVAAVAAEAAGVAEAEAARLLADAAAAQEIARVTAEAVVAAEAAAAEDAARLAAEAAAAEDAARLAAEAAAAEDAARLAAEAAAAAGEQPGAPIAADAAPAIAPETPADPLPQIPAQIPGPIPAPALPEVPSSGVAELLSDADALAAALAAAAAGETGLGLAVIDPATLTPEDTATLAEARETAAAAELVATPPVDPVAETEAQIATATAETETALQSLALAPETAPIAQIVTEVITQDTSRSSDQDFERLMTATTDPAVTTAAPRDRTGLTGTQGLLLGAIGGLVVGSIIAGNREVVSRADDRVVVLRPEGDYQVIRDDDVLLRRPGNSVVTESFADGSSRNITTQPDGTQVITVRDRDLRILRRTVVAPDGTRTVLIDDTAALSPVRVSQLPKLRPGDGLMLDGTSADAQALARALAVQSGVDRNFSLAQIRSIRAVRDLAPALNLEAVTFASGSAAVTPDQAGRLLALGRYMSDAVARNPREVFLIEGHTDAVGSASFNLALSDRRAESVALALTEYFGVPPQNMIIQGYGEDFLLRATLQDERLNRRVAVRRITDLLRVAVAD
jgi:outer membrane protein OmpA-like peptidoglycan-associated protein